MRFAAILLLAGFGAGHLAGATGANTAHLGLVHNSPFGEKPGSPPATSPAASCQFRAVLEEQGRLYFSVFNLRTHRSTWMSLDDNRDGLHVTAYDARTSTLTVECDGRTLTIPLLRADSGAAVFSAVARLAQPPPAELPQLSASDEKAIALEVERYKKLAAMAAAAREREIRAQENLRRN